MKKVCCMIVAALVWAVGFSGCGEKETGDAYRNFYEVFVGSYYDSDGDGTGDLNGITKKLDYIEEMGFDGIWLTPVMPSPSYHKYDVTDYYGIDPSFGTLEDYRKLAEECHKRGIVLTIDMVFNHTSSRHPWFTQACGYLEGLKPGEEPDVSVCPYFGYYHFRKGEEVNWHRVGNTEWYYEGVFWDGMPDLALENDEVRKELEKAADFWLDLGTDGFRLDAAKEYFTGYTEKNTEVLAWFTNHVKSVNPDAFLVAEVWEGQAAIQEYYRSGIDSLFNFPAAAQDGAIIKTARKSAEPAEFFDWLIRQRKADLEANPAYVDAPFISNHDTTRVSAQCVNDERQMKFSAGLLFMMPGSPYVYYGEEIGMKSMGTKDENKRLPMYWSARDTTGIPAPPADADRVEQKFPSLEEQEKDPQSILNYYKAALRIRKAYPEIARGEIAAVQGPFPEGTAATRREWQGETCIVVCSTAEGITAINLRECMPEGYNMKASLTVDGTAVTQKDGFLQIPEYGIAVLK